jgi:hypothetical protein
MPVEAEFGIERKVAAELEKERSKIPIDGIDVIVLASGIEGLISAHAVRGFPV